MASVVGIRWGPHGRRVDLEIVDTVQGRTWSRHNPAGTLVSVADTRSFARRERGVPRADSGRPIADSFSAVLRRLSIETWRSSRTSSIELGAGLTVITGETGAGKSILVDALALVAGGAAPRTSSAQGAERLTVAGEFDETPPVRRAPRRGRASRSGRRLDPGPPRARIRRPGPGVRRGRARGGPHPRAARRAPRRDSRPEPRSRISRTPTPRSTFWTRSPGRERSGSATRRRGRGGRRAGEARGARSLPPRAGPRGSRSSTSRSGRSRRSRPSSADEDGAPAERDRLLHADRIRQPARAALRALSEDEGSAADRLGEAARAFAELAAIDPREAPAPRRGGGARSAGSPTSPPPPATPPARSRPTRSG